MQRRPQVKDLAFLRALLGKALEDVGVQVDAEGAAAAVAPMQRTGSATLWTLTTPASRSAELIEDLRHR